MQAPTVGSVVSHMCQFGMRSNDGLGEALAMNSTRFASNLQIMLRELHRRCQGCPRHVRLMAGRASAAAVYPSGLCRADCRGVQKQLMADRDDMAMVALVAAREEVSAIDINELWGEEQVDDGQCGDDVSGKVLDPALTKAARAEEMQEAVRMGVWTQVDMSECVRVTGKKPIPTRWVDIDKGDSLHPLHRSRLAAKELKRGDTNFELFVATPPIEYVKCLVSRTASSQFGDRPTCLMVSDVKKAFFYAPAARAIYVELP